MKGFNILIVFFMISFACMGQDTSVTNSFGEKINEKNAISSAAMKEKYTAMSIADTLNTKFTGKVQEVCKVKGCWMKLKLDGGEETMVRFKDYGFFMPKDIEGKKVVVEGKAFVEEMSVADQKHFAKDGGASETEIAKIVKPKKTYGFEANGVLILE
ncbi:DUF4920 domain-containing protein [Maribacter sp. MMG018]|uniref:DUF4920 domain-containing protein n=1 Tax=Maribacter sp. MMG018 TaxID=2822688 RepID=UPI001B38A6F7|nr:DUF4920 domain-containing protein [Maribacter sp. MMG018]MBQ4914352.1 DUF4920 domain-containing protein [Maribacter sp. MMG018]